MNENENFGETFKFAIVVEYLLRAGIDVDTLQEGIRIIAENVE